MISNSNLCERCNGTKWVLEIGQVNLGLPVRLEQDSIDNVDVDRSSRGSNPGQTLFSVFDVMEIAGEPK